MRFAFPPYGLYGRQEDSNYLARLDNYPQIFKKPRYDLNIEGVMQVSTLEPMTTVLPVVAVEPQ